MGEAIGTLALEARCDSEMARQALETAQNGLEKTVGSCRNNPLTRLTKLGANDWSPISKPKKVAQKRR
jgi:hypothetical protein